MKRLFIISCAASLMLSGCVQSREVITTRPGDYDMTCDMLRDEISRLGGQFELSNSERGLTGKNVAVALVFWPGALVNEYQSSKNTQSIQRRSEHLTALYNAKCLKKAKSK